MTTIPPSDSDTIYAAGLALADCIKYGPVVDFNGAFDWHLSWLGVMRAAGVDPVDPNGEDGPPGARLQQPIERVTREDGLGWARALRWAAVVYLTVGLAVVLARLAWS